VAKDKTPVRWARSGSSVELTWFRFLLLKSFRLLTWFFRRCKPVIYHPIAWPGIFLFGWALTVSFMFAAYLLLAGFLTGLMWYAWAPGSFREHVRPRLLGFVFGWYYRYRPRPRLTECHVLTPVNPIPTISRVRVNGPIHTVWIKKNWGDDTELWRSWATNIADTYNAGDAKIITYRRPTLTGWRLQLPIERRGWRIHFNHGRIQLRHNGVMADKWRWLQIEFMHKFPFSKVLEYPFLDFHRNPVLAVTMGNPVGILRDGTPFRLNVERHLLVFAMTQWGKSNAQRTMIYADKDDVAAGDLENWMIELKRGVEGSTLESQLARWEYGLQGPEKVLQFVLEIQAAVEARLDKMRRAGVVHYSQLPNASDRRRVKVYVDEWLKFEEPKYAQVKNNIYRAFGDILNQTAAAGFQIIAFAQQPKKDKFELRDYFNEVWVGAMKTRSQVAMAADNDAYERGMRASDLPTDLRGVFYIETENGRLVDMTRIALTPVDVVRDLPNCPPSAVWPVAAPFRGYFPTVPPMPPDSLTAIPAAPELGSEPVEKHEAEPAIEPEPERELAPAGRLTDL
jgi:hypothetical protein